MKKIIPIVITAVVVGALGFYGGMRYGRGIFSPGARQGFQNLSPEERQQRFAQMGARQGGNMQGADISAGEILSKDDKSITIKLRDGGSKIILVSGSAVIMKSVSGTNSDLSVGQQVTITGDPNADGSVSARTVQIRPASSTVN